MRLITALSLFALVASPAAAAELPNDAPEGKRWMSCFIALKDANTTYSPRTIAVGGYWLIDVPADARRETENRLRDVWVNEYVSRIPSEFPGKIADTQNGTGYDARCGSYESRGEWASYAAHVKEPITSTSTLRSDFVPSFAEAWVSTREHARGYQGEVASSGSIKAKRSSSEDMKPDRTRERPAKPSENAVTTPAGPSAAELAAQRHADVERRNREKQAKYEADMKAWQAQIDSQNAEEARKQAKFEADKQQAAQTLSAFESEQAAHRRQMEAHAQQVLEHQAAQQRHSLCVAGDRSACGPAAEGQLAQANDAGQASTDTDARQCVTQPVLSPNTAFKGSIKAVVTNGCDKPVDVRICLMRTGGWNCGMTLGLKPQDQWSWWTSEPQDGVFWDARTSGSNRSLGHPAGA